MIRRLEVTAGIEGEVEGGVGAVVVTTALSGITATWATEEVEAATGEDIIAVAEADSEATAAEEISTETKSEAEAEGCLISGMTRTDERTGETSGRGTTAARSDLTGGTSGRTEERTINPRPPWPPPQPPTRRRRLRGSD